MSFWARRKAFDSHTKVEADRQMRKTLSWPHLVALGIGGIIGTGIYTLTGIGAERAGDHAEAAQHFAGAETRGQDIKRAGAAPQQGGWAGGRRLRLGGQPWAFAALPGTGDAHGHRCTVGQGGGAGTVGQEAFRVGQGDERPGHGGHTGDDTATKHIAHPVRRPRADQGEIQRAKRVTGGHAPFARRCIHQQDHGVSQPAPRSNCAVSNNGRPTTLEWLPDRKRTCAAACP